MKVIFLDVDGVLNSEKSRNEMYDNNENWMWNEVAYYHLEKLKKIVEKTGATIVLSSSWRLYHPKLTGFSEVKDELLKVLIDKMNNLGLKIEDVTPDFHDRWRGCEIEDWLKNHPEVEKYIILDDDTDFLPEQKPFFIKTTFKEGLTDELTEKAIQILKE